MDLKSYSIKLTESELIDVVAALESQRDRDLGLYDAGMRHWPHGSSSLLSTPLSRRIADQAAEQLHEAIDQP